MFVHKSSKKGDLAEYMEQLTGRQAERDILKGRLASGSPELIALYGRRRVGKTFLVRNFFKDHLQNFSIALQKAMKMAIPPAQPSNWQEAFLQLDQFIDKLPGKKPAVLFFDEFPWINSQKSGFLKAFDHWWN
jgi:AAA+ ATPase superfamily predicted ATPase